MNNIINNAVKLSNDSKQAAAEREGQRLIELILGEQTAARNYAAVVEEKQKALKAIADKAVTVESVMGSHRLPGEENPNARTIREAIAKLNKSNQDRVNVDSTNLVNDIERNQGLIAECGKRIADYREKLLKLSAESVTVGSVMGS